MQRVYAVLGNQEHQRSDLQHQTATRRCVQEAVHLSLKRERMPPVASALLAEHREYQ